MSFFHRLNAWLWTWMDSLIDTLPDEEVKRAYEESRRDVV